MTLEQHPSTAVFTRRSWVVNALCIQPLAAGPLNGDVLLNAVRESVDRLALVDSTFSWSSWSGITIEDRVAVLARIEAIVADPSWCECSSTTFHIGERGVTFLADVECDPRVASLVKAAR